MKKMTILLLILSVFALVGCNQMQKDNNETTNHSNIINGNFNNSFVSFIKSHNYNTKICNIIKNEDNSMIISNYLDKDCNLFIGNDFNRTISDNSTIKIDNFINKMPIYLFNCTYINKDIYYIETNNYNNQIIYKNMR